MGIPHVVVSQQVQGFEEMEESPSRSVAIEVNWFLLLLILCTCVMAHILHRFSSSFITWVKRC